MSSVASVSKETVVEAVTLEIEPSSRLCSYCAKLFRDILGPRESFGEGWIEIVYPGKRKPSGDFYLAEHHDGRIGSLHASGRQGCNACLVMSNYTIDKYDVTTTSTTGRFSFPENCRYRFNHDPHYMQLILQVEIPRVLDPDRNRWACFNFEPYVKQEKMEHWKDVGVGYRHTWPLTTQWPELNVRLNSHSGSEEAFARAVWWSQECLWNHPSCFRPPQKLPKRILEIGLDARPPRWVRLVETSGEEAHYTALSYSWGKTLATKTLKKNLSSHRDGIPLEKLSRTLRDAVVIAGRLGLRYIWIDALCIVQDDEKDWAEQAAQMTNIFNLASLVISATSASDCESGIFSQVATHGTSVGRIIIRGSVSSTREVYIDHLRHSLSLGSKSLFKRGWTMQEHLVPQKVLYYTDDGMAWECYSVRYAEACVYHVESTPSSERETFRTLSSVPQTNNSSIPQVYEIAPSQRLEFFRTWQHWTADLTSRNFTFLEDKLPAIAGTAKFMATTMNLRYAAGLWQENLLLDLLWKRKPLALALKRHPSTVPSWSWASVSGKIMHYSLDLLPGIGLDARIKSVIVEEEHPGTFGRVKSSKIKLDGWIQEVRCERLPAEIEWDYDHQVTTDLNLPKAGKRNSWPGVWWPQAKKKATTSYHEPRPLVVIAFDEVDSDSSDDAEPEKDCWLLRIGRAKKFKHEEIFMLALEKTYERDEFRRIGLARTSWVGEEDERERPVPEDIFVHGEWRSITLV